MVQSKYVEAIGIIEELLRIKKINFGINSKEVRKKYLSKPLFVMIIVHQIVQAVVRDLQHFGRLLSEEGRHQ